MSNDPSPDTLLRICGEFLEMPGLQLTCRQAQRLWGLEPEVCASLLDELVQAGFLYHRAGTYARISDGRFSLPRPTPAKAALHAAPVPASKILAS